MSSSSNDSYSDVEFSLKDTNGNLNWEYESVTKDTVVMVKELKQGEKYYLDVISAEAGVIIQYKCITGLALESQPNKVDYNYQLDRYIQRDGLKVKLTYADGTTEVINSKDSDFDKYSIEVKYAGVYEANEKYGPIFSIGTHPVSVELGELKAQFNINVATVEKKAIVVTDENLTTSLKADKVSGQYIFKYTYTGTKKGM